MGRNKSLFGANADAFRPERWFEMSPEQLKACGAYLWASEFSGYMNLTMEQKQIACSLVLEYALALENVYHSIQRGHISHD